MSTKTENGKKSFLKIRNQCGLLGVMLPWIALFSAGIAQHPGPDWWWSISATYYQSPALVAVMMPTCLVLYNYIGYDWLDKLITDLSALCGLGLVLFPCKVSWIPDGTKVGFFQLPVEISGILHLVFAGLFFVFIAFNSIFLFTKSKEGVEPTPQKKIRNTIYRICGYCTLALVGCIGLTVIGVLPECFQMYIEILLLTIFGFGWLVKGEFFPFLNDKKSRLYIASSWRNAHYPAVVDALRDEGFDVYDFRNPGPGKTGFKWEYVSPEWLDWTPEQYRDNLNHPLSEAQFDNDLEALESCDACVLVLPCGRSAHTEAGWFAGKGKKVVVYIPEKQEPELMYKLFNDVACSMEELVSMLQD